MTIALTAPSQHNGIDWLATQNGGQFDPVLFGDYRDSQDAIVGDGDFNNGFFNEAFPYDFASPLNFDFSSPKPAQQQDQAKPQPQTQVQSQGQTKPAQIASAAALADIEKIREGLDDDYGLPSAPIPQPITSSSAAASNPTVPGPDCATNMLSANSIWTALQNNRDFQDGKFDLDALCSELRAKAKCSESGVVIPAEAVDLTFRKLGGADMTPTHDFVFDQGHVDDALARLGGNGGSGGAVPATNVGSGSGSNWGGMGL